MAKRQAQGDLERLALQRGLKIGAARREILRTLDGTDTSVSARELYERTLHLEHPVSLPTVHATLRKLVAIGILDVVPSTGTTMRYRKSGSLHVEQLIDVRTGRIYDFRNDRVAAVLREVARELGYQLLDFRLELFAVTQEAIANGAPSEK